MTENLGKAPPHYTQGKTEAWDVMETCICRSEESFVDYLRCSIYKYVVRSPHKGQERDDVIKIMNFAKRWLAVIDGKPDYWTCDLCGYDKVSAEAGRYGCPNCYGEGWPQPSKSKVEEYISSLQHTGGRP